MIFLIVHVYMTSTGETVTSNVTAMIIIIALDLLKYPDMFFSIETSREIAFWMWLVGSIGIYVAAFVVLPKIYRSDAIELSHANFGWFIPPVAKLLIPVAGFELAMLYSDRFELTFGLSITSFGIGFFLFLFVGSLVYHHYVLESLPVSRFAATSFIAIAPMAIIAVALFKMMHLFEAGTPLDIDAHAIEAVSVLGILAAWGFAAWSFVMAVIIVIAYLRHLDLPYALSWWAYTFPLGSLGVATGGAWKVKRVREYPLVLHRCHRRSLCSMDHRCSENGTSDVVGKGLRVAAPAPSGDSIRPVGSDHGE
ncbi:MAG: hypothetical protein M3096_00360 [Actinomycetia bacterium]|nr:hypothetical protein [Actinomycetes bacterium]